MAKRPSRRRERSDPFYLLRLMLLMRSELWAIGEAYSLTPAQLQMLVYLAHANEFSRSPAALADFSGTTRGTISQTLKLLERKELVERKPDPYDGRSLRVDLTPAGRRLVRGPKGYEALMRKLDRSLSASEQSAMELGVRGTLDSLVDRSDHAPFGTCTECKQFEGRKGQRGQCSLLGVHRVPSRQGEYCQYVELDN